MQHQRGFDFAANHAAVMLQLFEPRRAVFAAQMAGEDVPANMAAGELVECSWRTIDHGRGVVRPADAVLHRIFVATPIAVEYAGGIDEEQAI